MTPRQRIQKRRNYLRRNPYWANRTKEEGRFTKDLHAYREKMRWMDERIAVAKAADKEYMDSIDNT